MISKLPKWVWSGTWFLACIAGMINVIGLLGFGHETISHLTGNTSRLAQGIANLDYPTTSHVVLLITSFLLGTVVSGFVIKDSVLKLDGNYGLVLLIEALLLCIAVPLLQAHSFYGSYATACACGLQNAMASTYSGAVVRTTHLSGMFTDLGIFLGHALRGIPVNSKRLWLCFIVISGFLSGGIVGTLAFNTFSYSALLFPAALTATVASLMGLHQYRNRLGK